MNKEDVLQIIKDSIIEKSHSETERSPANADGRVVVYSKGLVIIQTIVNLMITIGGAIWRYFSM